MYILNLGKLIDPYEFQSYIDEAEKLESVVHRYGSNFVIPDYPCWMEYKNEGDVLGSISFTRHTNKHPILSEMVKKVLDILTPIFPDNSPPMIGRVHLIRTLGNIVPHRDEAGRYACINIGVKNSSKSITKISNDNIYENFDNNNTPYVIKEGFGYLLNTNQIHAVEGQLDVPRYLITYGFGTKFEVLQKIIKAKNE
jgi:uncharacterized protein (DUF1330 family)